MVLEPDRPPTYRSGPRFRAALIEVADEEVVNGRARRYYRLTGHGRGALRAEAARMAEAARIVTERGRRRATRRAGVQPA